MFEELTKEAQDAKTKNWKDPVAHTVVATILFRSKTGVTAVRGLIDDDVEFLVTRRLRGPATGNLQSHHGGHVKVTDRDLVDAAIREVEEEVGFFLRRAELSLAAIIGPELYRSTLAITNGTLELTILDLQAEPTAPFVCSLFVADVTGKERQPDCDQEVDRGEWLTLQEIVSSHGQSMQFNYFSLLMAGLRAILGQAHLFPDSRPGTYRLRLARTS